MQVLLLIVVFGQIDQAMSNLGGPAPAKVVAVQIRQPVIVNGTVNIKSDAGIAVMLAPGSGVKVTNSISVESVKSPVKLETGSSVNVGSVRDEVSVAFRTPQAVRIDGASVVGLAGGTFLPDGGGLVVAAASYARAQASRSGSMSAGVSLDVVGLVEARSFLRITSVGAGVLRCSLGSKADSTSFGFVVAAVDGSGSHVELPGWRGSVSCYCESAIDAGCVYAVAAY